MIYIQDIKQDNVKQHDVIALDYPFSFAKTIKLYLICEIILNSDKNISCIQ